MVAPAGDALAFERRDFTLMRLVRAPRPAVFRAFVEPECMKHWWVPRGYTMLSCALDLREGGAWRMRIKADQGGPVQTEVGVYRTIRAPELLTFTHAWVRANGTLTRTTLITVRFEERADGTEVSFRQEDFASAAACRSHEDGWAVSLSQLTDYLGERKSS
ncbi:MAG: SRPBCC domain-containing protein [Alphaproteobacteria bacterium]|nr:SRPBCC domain-containing protein [Alphaproteobacteria bacterium]